MKELENVSIFEYTTMTDILEEEGRCTGIVAENEEGIIYLHAKDTILASGGIGGTYKHSTNFAHLTGDALRIAKKSMEFAWSIWITCRFIRQHCIRKKTGKTISDIRVSAWGRSSVI